MGNMGGMGNMGMGGMGGMGNMGGMGGFGAMGGMGGMGGMGSSKGGMGGMGGKGAIAPSVSGEVNPSEELTFALGTWRNQLDDKAIVALQSVELQEAQIIIAELESKTGAIRNPSA